VKTAVPATPLLALMTSAVEAVVPPVPRGAPPQPAAASAHARAATTIGVSLLVMLI